MFRDISWIVFVLAYFFVNINLKVEL